jgi:hypothetical protein
MWKERRNRTGHRRTGRLLLAVLLAILTLGVQPAAAATVVNYAFQTPVRLDVNPCTPGEVPDIGNFPRPRSPRP